MSRSSWRTLLFVGLFAVGLVAAFFIPSALRGMREEAATVPPEPAPRPEPRPRVQKNGVRKPKPKVCLQPEALDLGAGDEMGAVRVGVGLSPQQIKSSFQPLLEFLNGCRPDDGGDHSGHVTYEFHVGCDGLVKGIEIVDDSLYEPQMLDCLRERLMYVAFPAHDQEDGVWFEYPLIFH